MRILVIAPHADDEVLGCGGTIARRVQEGHAVDIAVVTIGKVCRPGQDTEIKATAEVRRSELNKAARILGTNMPVVLFDGYENKLDTLPRIELVSRLDMLLDSRYDQVFFPYPSHHQDHVIVYEACFSALREKGNDRAPSLIAMYEYAYVGWMPYTIAGGRYYVDITPQMAIKCHALLAYQSQSCPSPHPCSADAMETLARMRGLECGRSFAELFYLLKMVDGVPR